METLGKRFSEAIKNLLPDSWDEIYEKARGFGTGLADFLNGLIQPDMLYELGQSVAGILNTISEAIIAFLTGANWEQYEESFKAFWDGFKDEISLSTIRLVIDAIIIKKVGKWILGGAALKGLGAWLASTFGATAISATLVANGGILGFLNADLGVLLFGSTATAAGMAVGTALIGGIGAAYIGFNLGVDLGKLLMGDKAPDMTGKEIADELWDGIKKGDIWQATADWWVNDVEPSINKFKSLFINAFTEIDREQKQWTSGFAETLKAIDRWGVDTATSIVNTKNEWAQAIADWWVNDIEKWFSAETWREIGNNIKGGIASGWNNMVSWWKTTGFYSWWQDVKKNFSEEEWTFSGIMKGLGKSFMDAVEAIKEIMNEFFDWLAGKKNTWSEGGLALKGSSMPTGDFRNVRNYASGGFPEQGSLFLAGETYGQSEWIGDVNGRTGVVGGNEITGIAEAIYQTSSQEMELLRQQNQYLIGILNKEFGITRNQIGKEARGYARDYYESTGRQAFQF